ncbi:MAG: aldehyde dehydrogenase family protein [Planctomycetes bacterium]|nr:aldehyde dehydrogenase family protein [Planctomycetota bacterium]
MVAIDPKVPLWLAGEPRFSGDELEVTDKYHGAVVSRVALAGPELLDEAISRAAAARAECAALEPWQRREVLERCIARFTERQDDLADLLCIEAGKPLKDSRGEVARLIDTFRVAAHECLRVGSGDVLPLAISERASGYTGMWKRVPIGPCSFIAPFNFPLNLAAHKIAPAIAAGCPFVLKPASRTPLSAMILGEILAETKWPAGGMSILPMRRDAADALTTDDRIKLLSFTGSPEVGWDLHRRAGKKKVVLELGGNAACVVDAGTDLDLAIDRILVGAFYQSGQSCISVQRVLLHESLADEFERRFVSKAEQLVLGDPRDEATFLGPMIDESEAARLESWIEDGLSKGGRRLCGGARDGVLFPATVLADVPAGTKIVDEEAFGPVCVLSRFSDLDAAFDEVDRSRYGLQTGIFTKDIDAVLRAWDRLEVGGIVIGDVPSWRVDHMPYGGVKDSGFGREGVRFAIDDMTEIRLLAIRR